METLVEMTQKAKASIGCMDKTAVKFTRPVDVEERSAAFSSVGLNRAGWGEIQAAFERHVSAVTGLRKITVQEAGAMMGFKIKNYVTITNPYESRPHFEDYLKANDRPDRSVFGMRRNVVYGLGGWRGKKKVLRTGPIGNLGVPVPYGVALLCKELKETGLFKCFEALAPVEAFASQPRTIDPVIFAVADVMEYERNDTTGSQETRFFVAKW